MTDWESPAVILPEYTAYFEVVHVLFGLFIWEVIINLDFDYAILIQRRPFRSSSLLYLGARWFPFLTIILEVFGQNEPYLNCQVYVAFGYLFTYLGFLFASSLIILRIVAIWERNKVVITIVGVTWLVNFAVCIYSVTSVRAIWVAPLQMCDVLNILKIKFSIIAIFSNEVVLLTLMLIGLRRWKSRGKGGLWQLLFTQGLAWVVVTLVAEIPPLVLILLNLNVMMDVITHLPSLCIVSIAATRMYRGLSDYLRRTDYLHSTRVTPGAVPSNGTTFGNFASFPDTDNISGLGSIQSGGQSSVHAIGSLTVATSHDAGEGKAPSVGDASVGDENV